ncbi:S8 family serine peptidase [Aquidulcibacter paucihalophilus]|uniref:S8 family serine peptidase n=1 Tax=Aquidulcibacter paucihalophilus TaxID=1978549 RepID=UPI000A1970E3|nr:S8 family serine peptidase [Aquidulcibacter paucihalophilus]
MKSILLSMTAVAALVPCGAALAQTAALPTGQELAWSSAASRVGAFKPRPWAARGTNVTIAIIDSGIRRDHIDFAGAITGGYNAFTNLTGTAAVNDTNGHGTHVASLAAARANGVGMVGVASNARILPVQVFQGSSTSDFFVARGINYATSQRAFVMNLSLGGSTMSPTIRTALQGAQAAGLLMVIAAGNEGLANPSFPARHASEAWARGQIIAVGAVDANNVIANFSNRAGDARNFYLVAPGVSLIGAFPSAPNAYAMMSGTSMAAPVVAGAAAVVKSAWPFLTAPRVAEVLFVTATDLGARGIDPIYGRGLLNLERALLPVGTVTTVSSAGTTPLALAPTSAGAVAIGAKSFAANGGAFEGVVFDAFGRDFGYDFATKAQDLRPDSVSILATTLTNRMQATLASVATPSGTLSLMAAPAQAAGGDVSGGLHFIGNQGQSWAVAIGQASPILGASLTAGAAPSARLLGFADHTALFEGTTASVASQRTLENGVSLTLGARLQGEQYKRRGLNWTPNTTSQASSVEAVLSRTFDRVSLSASVAAIQEAQGRLGDVDSELFGLSGPARTLAVQTDLAFAVSSKTSLSARLTHTQTAAQVGAGASLVSSISATEATAYAINFAQRDFLAKGDQLDLAVGTPLTSRSGMMNLFLATGADPETGAPIMTRRGISLASKTPEQRFEAVYTRTLSPDSALAFAVMARQDADGIAGKDDQALMVRYQTSF